MSVGFGQVVIDSLRADDIAGFWSAMSIVATWIMLPSVAWPSRAV
jgi:hypothetical protein